MATEYKLSYTANEINEKLGKIDTLALKSEVPTNTSDLTNDSGFITNSALSNCIEYTELPNIFNTYLAGYTTESWVNKELEDYVHDTELQNAINDALAQAKESGEFDGKDGENGLSPRIAPDGNWWVGDINTGVKAAGKDGTSVTVSNVTESTADGGDNVVTFSDGNTVTIKNGSKGADGNSGVYVGSGTPPTGTKVQVDPDGEALEIPTMEDFDRLSEEIAEQQTALDAMSIEGMERTGDWVDVTSDATVYNGAYAKGNVGASIGNTVSSTYDYLVLSVNVGERIRVEGMYSQYIQGLILVDSNGIVVENYPGTNDSAAAKYENELIVPDGVAYLYVNQRVSYDFCGKFERYEISGFNFVKSDSDDDLQSTLDNMTIEGYEREKDYVDVTSNAVEYKGAYATGGVGGHITEAVSSAYDYYVMSVSTGEKYRIEGVYSKYIYGLYLVNNSNTVVARYPAANENGLTKFENEIIIPDGVVSIYVNQKLGTYADNTFATKIERMEVSGFSFVRSENVLANNTWDWLYGKKLACVGDSITEASNPEGGYFKNYAEIVAERHGMTVYKDGKGGSTMANVTDHRPFCVDRYTNVPSDFDILTIWFGWNDASYSQIGTIDSTEDTTYYGAYKKVLDYFITTYPTKKIGLIVPYGNSSVDPFREAVRKLSEAYGVPCLDLADGKQCSLLWGTANSAQEARRAALTYDSTHPNQTGHEYLATMYEAFIQRL